MASKKGQNKTQQQRNEIRDYTIFKTVLFYCLLIIILPLVTFWVLKRCVFDEYLLLGTIQSNIYSAIGSVIALHVALGLYIYRAYFDEESDNNTVKKQD